MTVILDEPFKSEVLARQVLGRTRDDNTICIECVDRGFRQCHKYYLNKQPVMQKYAKSCTEVRLSDTQLSSRVDKILKEREGIISPLLFGEEDLINPLIKKENSH
jgi:hypothetical protein